LVEAELDNMYSPGNLVKNQTQEVLP